MASPIEDTGYRPNRLDWDEDDSATLEPLEPRFWARYNRHLEFPTSILIAVLLMSMVFGFIVLVMVAMLSGEDKKSVPISLVDGGQDDTGVGSPGSGGNPDPLALGQSALQEQDFKNLALPKDLPQVREDIQKQIDIDDPTASVPLPDEKAAAYGSLSEDIRKKLLGIGEKKGTGPGTGSGNSGQDGSGPGGIGADSTRSRSIRWVLRFRTAGGRDYLDQLQALKAVVLVPLENSNRQMYLFRDLANPRPGTIATDGDIAQLSRQIQFSDFRQESTRQVGSALGLSYTPNVFWAFFPVDLEKELARLEVSYRNRRPEDIEETVYQVTVRGGQYQLVVAEQRVKR